MTRLLLDTHALLFWMTDDPRLSSTARKAIASTTNEVVVSAASAWEIATEHRLGRLPDAAPLLADFTGVVAREGFSMLSIDAKHAVLAGTMDGAHRDPFDRVLAAQALIEGLRVVTSDAEIAAFRARCLW